MSQLTQCPRCHEYRWGTCSCALFHAQHDWSPEKSPWSKPPDEGNWTSIYATETEYAAEKFAEQSDRDGDYTIISCGEGRIWVKDSEGTVTRWNIQAESVPSYSAHQMGAL